MSRQDADAAEASSHDVLASIEMRRARPPAARDMVLSRPQIDVMVRAFDMIRSTMGRLVEAQMLSERERRACLRMQVQAGVTIDRHLINAAIPARVVMALRSDLLHAHTLLEQVGERYGRRLQRGDRQILDMVQTAIFAARDIVLMVHDTADDDTPDARSAS